ncbi:MAG: methionine--tRNA ligase [Lentisphaeria bacterium]|nr:methionine--tRNA ligase [Lentisphaeria bacterium]
MTMSEKFYVTTPIYYVNDRPHIGHAYTTVLADVLARTHRSLADRTFFLTGTDEHGQKVQNAAEKRGVDPLTHCDETVVRFQELWQRLGITNDYFIRTTQESHKKIVSRIMQDLYDRDEIYKADYTGWYCVGCERFFTEKDLIDGKCPDCSRDVNAITESNYFFRMSKYQDWLIDYIQTHPEFIQPAFRANETLGFLKKPLGDLCISRPKSRLNWGIELPFDPEYVCYVWFDALINYISGVGYGSDEEKFNSWWPASCHLIGKDILTTHTVYWPTMLKAIGLPMPQTIFAHGWWLTGNSKMSKSLGNVVNPMDMIDRAGVDAFRYFLMAEMSPGNDANFSEDGFIARYNSDLANDLGNLLSRVSKLTIRATGGEIPHPGECNDDDAELAAAVNAAIGNMAASLNSYKLDQGINAAMNAVRAGNRYLEKCAPWTLAKNGDTARLHTVLHNAADALCRVAVLLTPVMPEKMAELLAVLGADRAGISGISGLKDLKSVAGFVMKETDPLFPRIVVEEDAAKTGKAPKTEKKAKAEKAPAAKEVPVNVVVTIDEFFKTKLKTAQVLTAEKVDGADKLLKLSIEVGSETRQLVAGVAQFYTPEAIVGKTIVIVANLKPAKIRGIESQGMLLAAKNGDSLKLVTIDGDMPSGIDIG